MVVISSIYNLGLEKGWGKHGALCLAKQMESVSLSFIHSQTHIIGLGDVIIISQQTQHVNQKE